jgi:subtilisin family serine protease
MKTVRGGAVSIAILDTGIDLSHPMLVGKIAEGDCWDFVSESANVGDEVGHGTHTTSLLLKTAPRARIFCARVWRTRKEENSTGELVAKVPQTATFVIRMMLTYYRLSSMPSTRGT